MLHRVRDTVERHRMFREGSRVGVAVSGGVDSVVLLHCLQELAGTFGISLAVLHLNHMLRGEEAEEDATFVAGLAAASGLDLYSEALDVQSLGGNLEQAGRDARRSFFRRLRSAGLVDAIATGHTESDQAETVLYRLLRGTGTAGLRGVLPVTPDGLVRPLLECSRPEIEQFAHLAGLTWREDRTNADPQFVRNRIRHRLLPAIQAEYSPAIREILSATAAVARDEEEYWARKVNRLTAKMLLRRGRSVLLNADEIRPLQPAVARRLIRRAFQEVKRDLLGIDTSHVERVLALSRRGEGHDRVQVPGVDVIRSFEWIRLAPPRVGQRSDSDFSLAIDFSDAEKDNFELTLPQSDGYQILRLQRRTAHALPANCGTTVDELDAARTGDRLELRNWQPGDTVNRSGGGLRKLKALFQDARVPLWERHTWPVLTAGSEIVWTRLFGVSSGYKPEINCRTFLRVCEIEAGESPRYSSDTLT